VTNWQATVTAMETPVAQLDKPLKTVSRPSKALFGVLTLLYLGFLIIAYNSFLDAWQTNDWDSFNGLVSFVVRMLALLPLILGVPLKQLLEGSDTVLKVRRAAIAGDDALAPPAAQPDPAVSQDVFVSQDDLLYFRGPSGGRQAARRLGAVLFLIIGSLLALFTMLIALVAWRDPIGLLSIAIFGGLAMFALVPGFVFLAHGRQSRTMHVRADDVGLCWRQRRRCVSITWQELQAFSTVHYRRNKDGLHYDIYALDAPGAVLAWQLTKTSSDDERAAHRYLSTMIVARTSLRLRDLTESIEKLEQEAVAARKGSRSTRPEPLQFPLPTVPATVPPLPEPPIPHAPVARNRPKISLGCAGSVLLMLPALLLFPLGWGAQQYEPHYYAALVQRVHAEQPKYQDTLTRDSGAWWVTQPRTDDPRKLIFSGTGYQLGGGPSSKFVDSSLSVIYGDVATQVTVQEMGSDPQNDGAGLELRVREPPVTGAYPDKMVAYYVTTGGMWFLWNYRYVDDNANDNWDLVDSGHSSAIHTGSNTTNQLLVIAHGSQFILYANDTFLATETVDGASDSGYIGVYSNDAALTARFTNFAIYPLPSLAPPLPWAS
jgi:hypothetical protein